MRVAGIDIGTNTILMLIADIDENGKVLPIADFHSIARLGEGLNQSGIISQQAVQRTIKILIDYKKEIERFNVEKYFCVSTSAMREAKNSQEVIREIKVQTGFDVLVIDGDLEAYLSYIGTVEDAKHSVVLDIGGGSTEVIVGEQDEIIFRKSFKIGAVRLTEKYIPQHPPTKEIIDKIKKECIDNFVSIDKSLISGNVYAVAGTPTTIAAVVLGLKEYDRSKVDNFKLSLDEIRKTKELFLTLSIDEIVQKLYVPPMRADVITAGTIILESFCDHFALPEVIVSDKGLRFGVIKYFTGRLVKNC